MPTAPLTIEWDGQGEDESLADVEKVQILEFFNNLNIIINFEN